MMSLATFCRVMFVPQGSELVLLLSLLTVVVVAVSPPKVTSGRDCVVVSIGSDSL